MHDEQRYETDEEIREQEAGTEPEITPQREQQPLTGSREEPESSSERGHGDVDESSGDSADANRLRRKQGLP